MKLLPTLIGLVASIVIFIVCLIMDRRPVRIGRVRMIPYLAIMFVSLVAILLFVAHLLALSSPDAAVMNR